MEVPIHHQLTSVGRVSNAFDVGLVGLVEMTLIEIEVYGVFLLWVGLYIECFGLHVAVTEADLEIERLRDGHRQHSQNWKEQYCGVMFEGDEIVVHYAYVVDAVDCMQARHNVG